MSPDPRRLVQQYWWVALLPVGMLLGALLLGGGEDAPEPEATATTTTTTSALLEEPDDDEPWEPGALLQVPPGGTLVLTNATDVDARLRLTSYELGVEVDVDGTTDRLTADSVGVVTVPPRGAASITNTAAALLSVEFEVQSGAIFDIETIDP